MPISACHRLYRLFRTTEINAFLILAKKQARKKQTGQQESTKYRDGVLKIVPKNQVALLSTVSFRLSASGLSIGPCKSTSFIVVKNAIRCLCYRLISRYLPLIIAKIHFTDPKRPIHTFTVMSQLFSNKNSICRLFSK